MRDYVISAVLLEMKHLLHDPFNVLESWQEGNTSAVCMWEGIECNECNRVVTIDLADRALRGTLPSTLQDLEFLQNL